MKKTFKKHYVKRDPATLKLMSTGDEPVVGDFIREARITDEVANELNSNWPNSGHIWVEVKEAKKEVKKEVEETDDEKKLLWEKVEEMLKDGSLDKRPHHATGINKLKEITGE